MGSGWRVVFGDGEWMEGSVWGWGVDGGQCLGTGSGWRVVFGDGEWMEGIVGDGKVMKGSVWGWESDGG